MFGYIRPYMPYVYQKDNILYKAFYCGLCKSIGKSCGFRARMSLSYDMTFLTAFLHNIKNIDVQMKKERCVLHWIVPHPVIQDDAIMQYVAATNIILTYYKLQDDIVDENKGKFKQSFFKKGYQQAKKKYPKIEETVAKYMQILHTLEREKCSSIDRIADPFGCLVREIIALNLEDKMSNAIAKVAYNIGKWIYLIDALDDYDKDIQRQNYNPFYIAYMAKNKRELLQNYGQDINFIFGNIFSENALYIGQIEFYFNHDLTDNIILRGLPMQTQTVMQKLSKIEKKEQKLAMKAGIEIEK